MSDGDAGNIGDGVERARRAVKGDAEIQRARFCGWFVLGMKDKSQRKAKIHNEQSLAGIRAHFFLPKNENELAAIKKHFPFCFKTETLLPLPTSGRGPQAPIRPARSGIAARGGCDRPANPPRTPAVERLAH